MYSLLSVYCRLFNFPNIKQLNNKMHEMSSSKAFISNIKQGTLFDTMEPITLYNRKTTFN